MSDLKLWFKKPAAIWDEALPIGNGRLGAMIFGGVSQERLQLNESTLVSGHPGYRDLPLDARVDRAAISSALARGDFAEASRLVEEKWLGACWACYQPLGDLFLDFDAMDAAENYERELDLANALCRIRYTAGGVAFTREIFASHPDELIAIRLSANGPGNLNFRVRLASPHPVETRAEGERLSMRGQVPGFVLRRPLDWVEEKGDTWKYPEVWDKDGRRLPNAAQVLYNGRGVFFDARVEVKISGGNISAVGDALEISGADEAVLIYTAASSFNGFDKDPVTEGADSAAKSLATLEAASRFDFAELRKRHEADYLPLFSRMTIALGESSNLPTDERIKVPDPSLAALYFQFGRYLMIAGSRAGGQPLNLQGIWNEEIIPPWACQYTLNINAEMNYWPAQVGNLAECAEPYLRMPHELAVDGRRVAREMYGCRGWVAHHNTTLWREAQPVDNTAVAAYWPNGAGWLCIDLFEHYRFSVDRTFLETAYPLVKEAVLFYLDWLVEDEGRLTTPIGTSPEDTFFYNHADGKRVIASISAGSTMDISIIRELFRHTISAAAILEADADFRETLESTLAKLPPFQIGARGQLQEWQHDFLETEEDHRHVSHLFALHPAAQISRRGTPELAAAAKRTLELRGDGGTGWSKAWKICFWARLGDGDHAHKMLAELLAGSTLPNLFDTCPPFQIDGNFGGVAGIAEMLLQSQNGEIELLPALPAAWPMGEISGLRARGGYEVAISWEGGQLSKATIRADRDGECQVRLGETVRVLPMKAGQSYSFIAGLRTLS